MEDDAILKQVMVTGGRGFIGTALVNLLIDEGHDVVIVDISSQDPAIPPVDILDESRIDILMEGCDAVVHLAAQISVQASIDDPSHTKLINVDGTEVCSVPPHDMVSNASFMHRVRLCTEMRTVSHWMRTRQVPAYHLMLNRNGRMNANFGTGEVGIGNHRIEILQCLW